MTDNDPFLFRPSCWPNNWSNWRSDDVETFLDDPTVLKTNRNLKTTNKKKRVPQFQFALLKSDREKKLWHFNWVFFLQVFFSTLVLLFRFHFLGRFVDWTRYHRERISLDGGKKTSAGSTPFFPYKAREKSSAEWTVVISKVEGQSKKELSDWLFLFPYSFISIILSLFLLFLAEGNREGRRGTRRSVWRLQHRPPKSVPPPLCRAICRTGTTHSPVILADSDTTTATDDQSMRKRDRKIKATDKSSAIIHHLTDCICHEEMQIILWLSKDFNGNWAAVVYYGCPKSVGK